MIGGTGTARSRGTQAPLHNLPPRGTCAPGDGAAGSPPGRPRAGLGGAEAGRRTLTSARSSALSRGRGWRAGSRSQMRRPAGRAMRVQPGTVRSQLPAPGQRPAPPGNAPPRTCPRLTCVALWNCFFSPATDMVLGAREAAVDAGAGAGAGAGRRERRSGAAGPSGAARSRPPLVVQPRGRGRGAAERGLVRRDTLTSGRVMRPLKGDAGSPAPRAGQADRCCSPSHLGAGAPRADPAPSAGLAGLLPGQRAGRADGAWSLWCPGTRRTQVSRWLPGGRCSTLPAVL